MYSWFHYAKLYAACAGCIGFMMLKYKEGLGKYEWFKLDISGGSVKIGESVGIVGPNATGKTTFVKILAGAIEADSEIGRAHV